MSHAVAVMITTCRRPEGLRRLLDGLNAQQFHAAPPDVRIIVIDNDAAGSARAVCDKARPRLRWPIKYDVEPRPGISPARNAAIAAALATGPPEADWLALIDDDEVPASDWLDQLLDAATRHGADVVAGPVFPRFEQPPPDWVIRGRFFEPRMHRDGAVVDYAFGGNVLWQAGLCRDGGNRFGEHYGLIGGSDSEFFTRLHRGGRKIVWAQRAEAFEFVPPDRCTARWLVRRMYRAGNAGVLVARDLDGEGLRTNVILLCKAAAWLIIGAGQFLGGLAAGRHVRVRGRRHVAYGLGILAGLAGRRFEEYRTAHGAAR